MQLEQTAHSAYKTRALMRDILRFLRPYKAKFALATLIRLTGDLLRLYPPYALSQIINFLTKYEAGMSIDPLWRLIITSIAAALCYVPCRETAKLIGYRISEKASLDAQLQTIEHLCKLDLMWHERENSGNKLKRIQKGGEGIDQILHMWITNVIEVTVNFVGVIVIIGLFDWMISLFMLSFMLVYYIISFFITKHCGNASHRVNIQEENLHGIVFETMNNIRTVKVLGMTNAIIPRIEATMSVLFARITSRIGWFRVRDGVLSGFGNLFIYLMIGFMAFGVVNGRYELGFLVLFYDYFYKIWENVEEISRITLDFVVAKFGIARMMGILSEPVHIDIEKGKNTFPDQWKRISLRNVSFSYDENEALRNISFDIQRGEKIGIVGVSGAGKSTLFKLLLKEHEAYQGDIFFDDIPLRDIARSSYFQHSAVVLQDTEVFNFTLRDNITLSNVEAARDTKLLDQAIEISHVHDFMEKLPNGLDTFIGEKGIRLSGGEKQRVGIARAIFKQPQVLFLDEATSHLDMESEEKIKDSLHQFFQQVTAVVIAHRLSTIKEMDRIIVIEKGELIESGTFNALYAKKGRFYELWEMQKF